MSIDWDKVFGVRPSISADPEVLRVLYARLMQRNAESKALDRVIDEWETSQAPTTPMPSYYTDQTWREAITIADAQFLADLDISPL